MEVPECWQANRGPQSICLDICSHARTQPETLHTHTHRHTYVLWNQALRCFPLVCLWFQCNSLLWPRTVIAFEMVSVSLGQTTAGTPVCSSTPDTTQTEAGAFLCLLDQQHLHWAHQVDHFQLWPCVSARACMAACTWLALGRQSRLALQTFSC